MMSRPAIAAAGQRGYILLAMLLVMVIGGSTVVLGGLGNRQSAYSAQQQELREQMVAAKAALLAYAANHAVMYSGARGPGFFPCPDTDNDGLPESTCNSGATPTAGPIGRLPEYQDFAGSYFRFSNSYVGIDQQFWYVVAPRYVYDTATAGYRRSRLRTSTAHATAYWLKLDGTTEYVALLIAPGAALANQDRVSGPTNYTNYLDGNNGDSGFDFYTTDGSGDPDSFNDQVMGITYDEFMVAVGTAVARKVKTVVDTYALANGGAYPVDSGSLASTSCSSTTGTTFSNLFDSQEEWLRDASTSANGNNNERWSCPSGIYWNRLAATNTAELKYNNCSNLKFTFTYGGSVVRSGTGC